MQFVSADSRKGEVLMSRPITMDRVRDQGEGLFSSYQATADSVFCFKRLQD